MNDDTLITIERSLHTGCHLHAFRSGGGLRVVRLERGGRGGTLRGYGEHPDLLVALDHAAEDYRAGGRDYGDVYGKVHDHPLTGSAEATGELDAWVLCGNTFDARVEQAQIVVELHGHGRTPYPANVEEAVKAGGELVWKHRGYTYRTTASRFPNGEPCHTTAVIGKPDGANRGGADPWMWELTKTGRGRNLREAIAAAFAAEEVENVPPQR